jgi:hypothetical protein
MNISSLARCVPETILNRIHHAIYPFSFWSGRACQGSGTYAYQLCRLCLIAGSDGSGAGYQDVDGFGGRPPQHYAQCDRRYADCLRNARHMALLGALPPGQICTASTRQERADAVLLIWHLLACVFGWYVSSRYGFAASTMGNSAGIVCRSFWHRGFMHGLFDGWRCDTQPAPAAIPLIRKDEVNLRELILVITLVTGDPKQMLLIQTDY